MWENIVPIMVIVAVVIISIDKHHTRNDAVNIRNAKKYDELNDLKVRVAELEREVRDLKR